MITAPDYDREALINCLCDLKQRYDLDIYLEPELQLPLMQVFWLVRSWI